MGQTAKRVPNFYGQLPGIRAVGLENFSNINKRGGGAIIRYERVCDSLMNVVLLFREAGMHKCTAMSKKRHLIQMHKNLKKMNKLQKKTGSAAL